MSLMNRSAYNDHYGSSMLPALDEIFDSTIALHPSRRQALFEIRSMSGSIAQYSEVHDMDLFSQMEEGEEYSFKRPLQGASKNFEPVKYGLGFKITEEMVDDGKFPWIAKAVQYLARSAQESREVSAMNVLNNGFGTETTADGVSIFNSAHTLPSGGTFRNVLSTASDLSPTSLDTMMSDFETQFKSDNGSVLSMMPKILLVHSSQKRRAKEIVGSAQKADTADNNLNPFVDDQLIVVSSPHLTDTDAWFLLSEPSQNGLVIYERKPLETRAAGGDAGFKDDSILYKARYREVLGAEHGYGLFGTAGA